MKMTDVHWTSRVNMATIRCNCGTVFDCRMDVWVVRCPECRRKDWIARLRNEFARA